MTNNAINSTNPVGIGSGGTAASSFGTSNGVVAYNGTALVNYAGPTINSSGYQKSSTQPSFIAYNSAASIANISGDGTAYTVIWNATSLNQSSSLNTSTGIFTAPVAGNYLFTAWITALGISSSMTEGIVQIFTTAATYTIGRANYAAIRDLQSGSDLVGFSGAIIAAMSSGDTAKVVVTIAGGTKVAGIQTDYARSGFSGILVC